MLQLQPSTALPMATSRFGSFPPGGQHRGYSHPVTAKSLKPQHIACWGSCCCPELDRLGDRLACTKCERKHHVR